MSIVLAPSNDTSVLAAAIQRASATGQPLQLLPGRHFTQPGYNLDIPIGPLGLQMSAAPLGTAIVQRPDLSIGSNPLGRTDNNFGICLVPAPPTEQEIGGIQWRVHRPKNQPPFEYGIIIRGDVAISKLTFDCNMGNQNVDKLPKAAVEHDAMLAISGRRYDQSERGPDGLPLKIFVGFQSVSVDQLDFLHGGFADDLWFPPGGFHPNIVKVTISRVHSHRLNKRRDSISFSGLSLEISISDSVVDSLHCEVDPIWSDEPRATKLFRPSQWNVARVVTDRIAIGAKGKVLNMDASELKARESFEIAFASGRIQDSTLAIAPTRTRQFRLRQFLFKNCTWLLGRDSTGAVRGLQPVTAFGDPFVATFDGNSFLAPGPIKGSLITSGQYSRDVPGNRVDATFLKCHYQAGFGDQAANPGTFVALAHERGTWTFAAVDLPSASPAAAISKGAQADVVVNLV